MSPRPSTSVEDEQKYAVRDDYRLPPLDDRVLVDDRVHHTAQQRGAAVVRQIMADEDNIILTAGFDQRTGNAVLAGADAIDRLEIIMPGKQL